MYICLICMLDFQSIIFNNYGICQKIWLCSCMLTLWFLYHIINIPSNINVLPILSFETEISTCTFLEFFNDQSTHVVYISFCGTMRVNRHCGKQQVPHLSGWCNIIANVQLEIHKILKRCHVSNIFLIIFYIIYMSLLDWIMIVWIQAE